MGEIRRLVVYGSCQAQQLAAIFRDSPNVRAAFDIALQWVGDQAHEGPSWAAEIAQADVVLVQDVPELSCFPEGYWTQGRAKIVTYPFLTLSALWPFDTAHGEFDPAWRALQARGEGLAFRFQDKLLARMRDSIPDKEARFEAYRTLSCAKDPEIAAYLAALDPKTHLARCLDSLRRKDETHGLAIGHAIAAQNHLARMFHSVAHPTAAVLRRMGGELLSKLDVYLEPQSSLEDGFLPLQVPVHPLVAQALTLDWALKQRTWNVQGQPLTFEQYYRNYIETFG